MAEYSDTSDNNKTLSPDDSASDKSFVKKVKSRVSGFLPSSLSRWFGSTDSQVRYRDDTDDEEESFQEQPPTKKIKPNDTVTSVNFRVDSTSTPKQCDGSLKEPVGNINHVENKITFPEPIAGPSGFKPRKSITTGKSSLNKQLYTIQHEAINGDKYSDSGESVTSGYSSMRIGSKDVVTESKKETVNDNLNKSRFSFSTNYGNNDRSLFSDRCSSPQMLNSSLSSRQPSYNSSVFGSPNFVDRTLSSKRILNSPFYSGRTAYGGASAYGKQFITNLSDYKSSMRNTVQIKPINDKTTAKNNITLSKTARRILDTLEQYTTPITDAKKIPNPSIRKKYLSANPYSVREAKVPSNKELQVPTVPDLLKMKLKERLQDSTVSVRQIANSSKSVLNREEYKIRTLEDEEDKAGKQTYKMKNKISSVRQKTSPHRTVEEVKLPDIQLPISTLPKFDFSLPSVESLKNTATVTSLTETVKTSTSTLKTVEKKSNTQKSIETNKIESTTTETCKKDNNKTESNKTETKKIEYSKVTEFKFSDPVVIAENLKSIRAINNFIFSDPTPTKTTSSPATKEIDNVDSRKNLTKNNGECNSKKDSVCNTSLASLDVLKKNSNDLMTQFKASNDTWECSTCLIRNLNSKSKCAACESPKPVQNTSKSQNGKPPQGFGDKFKITDRQWECKVCLVVNSTDKLKCVACETPKEINSLKGSNENSKCVVCTASTIITNGPPKTSNNFEEKFKPPNTWSCNKCSTMNRQGTFICSFCGNAPPTSFGDVFKKKEDQWECDCCMVRNPQDRQRCQCCDALKPGAPHVDIPKEKSDISLFNFGVDTNATLTTKGFTFGIKPSENQMETPVINPIFGQNATSSVSATSTNNTPTFTFGIKPPTQQKSEGNEKNVTHTTGVDLLDSNKVKENEKVPMKPQIPQIVSTEVIKSTVNTNENKKEEKKDEDNTLINETKSPNTVFGIPSSKSTEKTVSSTITDFGKEPTPQPIFSFGANPTPVSTTSASLFGANPTQSTTPFFKFNGEETVTQKQQSYFQIPKPITFGNTDPQPQPPSMFGASNPSLFNANTKPNVFGTNAVEITPAPAFGVDNSQEEPPLAKPVFSFGQAKKPDAESTKFNFGAAPATPSGFNFVQTATQPSLNFNAGSNAAPPVINFNTGTASQNGAPIFSFGGGPSSTAKTAFNFGSNQPPIEQQTASNPPTTNTFKFGFSGSTPATNTGGFNFTNSATPDFKPNFNFTAGSQPPTFSAQPNPVENKSSRVIRRAVRRTHR